MYLINNVKVSMGQSTKDYFGSFILILAMVSLLFVAIYLIVVGLIGLNDIYHFIK